LSYLISVLTSGAYLKSQLSVSIFAFPSIRCKSWYSTITQFRQVFSKIKLLQKLVSCDSKANKLHSPLKHWSPNYLRRVLPISDSHIWFNCQRLPIRSLVLESRISNEFLVCPDLFHCKNYVCKNWVSFDRCRACSILSFELFDIISFDQRKKLPSDQLNSLWHSIYADNILSTLTTLKMLIFEIIRNRAFSLVRSWWGERAPMSRRDLFIRSKRTANPFPSVLSDQSNHSTWFLIRSKKRISIEY
jgi:hypothetical protein